MTVDRIGCGPVAAGAYLGVTRKRLEKAARADPARRLLPDSNRETTPP